MFDKLKASAIKAKEARGTFEKELQDLDQKIADKQAEISKQKQEVGKFCLADQMDSIEKKIEKAKNEALGRLRSSVIKNPKSSLFSIKGLFINAFSGELIVEGLLSWIDLDRLKNDLKTLFEEMTKNGNIAVPITNTPAAERMAKLDKLNKELVDLQAIRADIIG